MDKILKVRNIELGTGEPKIIVPITGRTKDEIVAQAQEIMGINTADLVEWRADYFLVLKSEINALNIAQIELLNVLKSLRDILGETPLIFTIRTRLEGGELDIKFEDYAALNLAAAESGLSDIIDIEIIGEFENVINLIKSIKNSDILVIGSKHDFKRTPPRDEIMKFLLKAQDAGADILKIAVMPERNQDVINLIGASAEFCEKYASRPVITISMGKLGALSRIACEISGSCATFGAVASSSGVERNKINTSAPGQISAVELRKILNILKI